MPSFSAISVFATLALAAFTSAVPTASPVVGLEVRAVELEARQLNLNLTGLTGLPLLNGLLGIVTSVTGSMTTDSSASDIGTGLGTVTNVIQDVVDMIESDSVNVLSGLGTSDVTNVVTELVSVLGPALTMVSGLISGGTLGGSDISALTGLVTLVLTLLGTLITLLLTLVPTLPLIGSLVSLLSAGSLLATVVSLVITLITPVISLLLTGLLPVVTSSGLLNLLGIFGVAGSFPSGLGGTLSIVAFVTPLLTALLPSLPGLTSL